jgi:ERCC4-type nuclease
MVFNNIFSNKKPKPNSVLPTITIDHREKNSLIPSHLTKLGFPIEFKQLPIADYLINNIAIERKTVSDFKSSIINKRILTQLQEIKQYPKHLLILEGSQNSLLDSTTIHENAARGFLLSTALDFQVPIISSINEKDTALYLSVLAKKPSKPYNPIRPIKTFLSKKEQIQYILEGFPNIGPKKAKALIKEFSSLSKIINAPIESLIPLLGKQALDFKALTE